jgi:FkbM family methyltransferase
VQSALVVGRSRFEVDGLQILAPSRLVRANIRYGLQAGSYEEAERQAIKHVDPSLPVLEVGGGLGVVSCAINRRLADPSQHVVVEMDPRLLKVIELNREVNGASFELRHAALWYGAGQPTAGFGNYVDRRAGDGGSTVPRLTVDQVLREKGWDQVNLVMDVEGMEHDLVDREWDAIADRVAVLVAEVHSHQGMEERCGKTLDRWAVSGFARHYVYGITHAFMRE